MKIRALCASILVLASFQTTAADIAREVVTSSDRGEAYAEIGFGFISGKEPLIGFNGQESIEESNDTTHGITINLDGRFRYKKFFIEIVQESFSTLTLGYILADSENSSLEMIGTNLFGDIARNDVPGLESITKRKGDFDLGFRHSTYRGDNVFQMELMADVSESHNGVIGALHAGRQKQIRNWNLHGLLGVRYFSDKVIDHYAGVSSEEATEAITEYEGKGGFMPSVQIGAILPINEKWLFKTQAEYYHLPNSVSDSPLAQGDALYSAQVGVVYVFGG